MESLPPPDGGTLLRADKRRSKPSMGHSFFPMRSISFDSAHEGSGRQIYRMDISEAVG